MELHQVRWTPNQAHGQHTQSGNQPNTKASEEAPGQEEWNRRRGSLQNNTKGENNGRGNKRKSTTKEVGEGRRRERPKEGAGRQDGDDGRGVRG